MELGTDCSVNGGRNSNDPKVNYVALVKPDHMLEHPQKLRSTRLIFYQAVKMIKTGGQSAGKTFNSFRQLN